MSAKNFLPILYYLKSARVCIKEALAFRAQIQPNDLQKMEIFYSQYIINMFSALDYYLDCVGASSDNSTRVCSYVDRDPNKAKNKISYLRELRNMCVHRGGSDL